MTFVRVQDSRVSCFIRRSGKSFVLTQCYGEVWLFVLSKPVTHTDNHMVLQIHMVQFIGMCEALPVLYFFIVTIGF